MRWAVSALHQQPWAWCYNPGGLTGKCVAGVNVVLGTRSPSPPPTHTRRYEQCVADCTAALALLLEQGGGTEQAPAVASDSGRCTAAAGGAAAGDVSCGRLGERTAAAAAAGSVQHVEELCALVMEWAASCGEHACCRHDAPKMLCCRAGHS